MGSSRTQLLDAFSNKIDDRLWEPINAMLAWVAPPSWPSPKGCLN
jgi:hypothetical protein